MCWQSLGLQNPGLCLSWHLQHMTVTLKTYPAEDSDLPSIIYRGMTGKKLEGSICHMRHRDWALLGPVLIVLPEAVMRIWRSLIFAKQACKPHV